MSNQSDFKKWLETSEGRKCETPPNSNTDKELQAAKLEAAFQAGKRSRKCECGEDSTGWTGFPCCNICGAIVEEEREVSKES